MHKEENTLLYAFISLYNCMRKNFKNSIKQLNRIQKRLTEDYLYNDEDNRMYEDEYDDGDMMQEPIEQENDMQEKGDSQEEIAMHAQEVIKHEPIIGKIRETAIEGLKKYSDNPTSSLYEFFKKVFLESDKVLTDNGNKK